MGNTNSLQDFSSARKGCRSTLQICSWNLEGLTDIKLADVCTYMVDNSLDICCIQETRKSNSDKYLHDSGHVVLLSGNGSGLREWAGVGFIVSPALQRFVVGFHPISSRMACLKVRVVGGLVAIFCVYSPHTLKPLVERVQFYDDLEIHLDRCKVNGGKFIFGDLNARLGCCKPGEENILGDYCYGREVQSAIELPNRDLLIEFCTSRSYVVSNTFVRNPPHFRATYFEPGAAPLDQMSEDKFNMLDLLLTPADYAESVRSIGSDRFAALATHHFPVSACLQVGILRSDREERLHEDQSQYDV